MSRSQTMALGLCGLLVATLMLADYLLLSLSNLLLGNKGNWLLLLQVGQILALLLVTRLGWLRGMRLGACGWGLLGFCILNLGHGCLLLGRGAGFEDYGVQKCLSVCTGLAPALLLGAAIGHRAALTGRIPGQALVPWLALPLLAAAGCAAIQEPEALTIARHADMALYFGCVVLPVHQALAFSLGKLACWGHAAALRGRSGAPGYLLVGLCLALSLLSGSRGYLLAAGLALLAQLVGHGLRPALLLPAALLPMLWLGTPDRPELTALFGPDVWASDSMLERGDLWQAASEAFAGHPMFGLGAGGFAAFLGYPGRVYPHNLFLEIACEYGIVGLLCLTAMLLPALARVAGSIGRRRATQVEIFALGLLVFGLAGVLGVADLLRNGYFFLALGLCQTCSGSLPQSQSQPSATLALQD